MKLVHEFPSNRRFRSRIHRLLRRTDTRGSADIIYVIEFSFSEYIEFKWLDL